MLRPRYPSATLLVPLLLVTANALSIGVSPLAVAKVTTLRLSLWPDNSTLPATQAQIKEFEKLNPDIRVKLEIVGGNYEEKTQLSIVAGAAPDVIEFQDEPYHAYTSRGIFLDLTPFVERDKAQLKDDFADYWGTQLQVCKWKGRFYGLPCQVGGGSILWYNKNLVEQAGLRDPDKNWDWNDFINYAKKMTRDTSGDGKPDYFGYQVNGWWPYALNWIWGAGGDIMNEERTRPTVDNAAVAEGLEFYAAPAVKYQISGPPTFESGKLGIVNNGSWGLDWYMKNCKFKWDIANLPRHPKTGVRNARVSWNIACIPKNCKRKAEAWRLVKFLASRRASQISMDVTNIAFPPGKTASTKVVDASTPQHEEVLIDSLEEYGRLQPLNAKWTAMDKVWTEEIPALLSGKLPATEVARRIQRKLLLVYR